MTKAGEHDADTLRVPKSRLNAVEARAPLRVLSLTGGGYRGLFTAKTLVALCKDARTLGPVTSSIDVFAGTSIGGLMSCALAVGIVPQRVLDVIDEHGPKVFKRKKLKTLRRTLFGSLYDAGCLEEAIDACLRDQGSIKMSELDKGLIVPAVDWVEGRVQMFMSGFFGQAHASSATLREVCLATSAAPTYFKPSQVNGAPMLDGGLAANNPDALALMEILRRFPEALPRIEMLSIGTAGADNGRTVESSDRSGLGWAPDIATFLIDVQERLAASQAARLLGGRYLRVNHAGSPSQTFSNMDVADKKARKELLEAGQEAADQSYRTSADFIDRFLNADRARPTHASATKRHR